jgi:hypothetical protein
MIIIIIITNDNLFAIPWANFETWCVGLTFSLVFT